MSPFLLYALIIIVYLPGVVSLALWRKCWRFPILFSAFLGMFVFNAIGSIGVISDNKIYRLEFDVRDVINDFALVLVYQVCVFYLFIGMYVGLRRRGKVVFRVAQADIVLCAVIGLLIVLIAGFYFNEMGSFLLMSALDGSMNTENALSYRGERVYGNKNWPIYNLGFVFLPVLLSSYGLILAKNEKRYRVFFLVAICISFGSSLSLGSKAGVISFVMSLGVAYMSYQGMTGQSIWGVVRSRIFLCFSMVSVALMFVGYIRATPESLDLQSLIERICYRVFVAYPDSIAAAISYARNYGELGESVIPTIRGLLPHEQINLSLALHAYQAGTPGGVSVPMAGEAFIAAGWPGVILVLPLVYIVLILLQELAFCFTEGLTSISFTALYAYLVVGLSMNGMFSSLFNLMYPGMVMFLGVVVASLIWASRKIRALSSRQSVVSYE